MLVLTRLEGPVLDRVRAPSSGKVRPIWVPSTPRFIESSWARVLPSEDSPWGDPNRAAASSPRQTSLWCTALGPFGTDILHLLMATSQQMPTPFRSASVARASSSFSPGPSGKLDDVQQPDEDPVFDTPSDLVCPITHEIFRDPVITAAGQVYERDSIMVFLQKHNTDPVTRMPLAGKTLTPIYILRSRARDFREQTARTCVSRACTPGCREPVKYVRRAAELCGSLDVEVQGMTAECIHHQAELLLKCIACWSNNQDEPEDEAATFEKLAAFVDQQPDLGWGQLIDIVQEAGLGEDFTTRLCEQLLKASPGGSNPQDWQRQREVLLKYIQVTSHRMRTTQMEGDARLLQLEDRFVEDLSPEKENSSSQSNLDAGMQQIIQIRRKLILLRTCLTCNNHEATLCD
ncbi:hypothetical protein WJX84_011105 [Apatococcus fuscideae]|uniref:U-box domain-containing protein n=1 Tax=Apatococcus fuscideae TaxID=2026836 RepID=A0AAW1TKJ5_9CHLO